MSDLLTINSAKQGFSWAIDKLLDQAEGGDQEAIGALSSLDTTKIKLDQTQEERFSKLEAKRDQAKLSNGLAGNPEPVGDTFVTSFLQNQKPNFSPETMAIARGETPETRSISDIKTKPLSDIGILDPKPAKSPAEEEAELCRESAIEGIVLVYNTAIDMLKNASYGPVGTLGNAIATGIGNIFGLPMGNANAIRDLEQKKQTAIKELNACIEDKPKFDQKFFELTGVRYNERNIKNFCEAVSQGNNDWTTAYDKAFGTPVDIKALSKSLKIQKVADMVGNVAAVPVAAELLAAAPAIATLGGGAVVLASCTEKPLELDPADVYVKIESEDYVKNHYPSELQDIIDALNKIIANQNDKIEELINAVTTLIGKTDKSNETMQYILVAIIDKAQEQELQLTQIIDALLEAAEKDNAIYEAIIDSAKKIFDKLDNLNGDLQNTLSKIYEAIDDKNTLTAEQNKMIIQMLEILQNIADKQTEQTEIITETNEMLKYIAGKLNDMAADEAEYYEEILSALTGLSGELDKLSGDQTELLKAILEQINTAIRKGDDANKETNAMLAAILDKLDELGDESAKALAKILEAINENTDIAKGTQELVTEILDKLGEIKTGEYDSYLSDIKALLTDLLEETKSNNSTLNNIDDKLAVLTKVVNIMMENIGNTNDALYKMLQEIYNKIPEGCNCTETDLTVIIELLKVIVENIGSTDSNTNEGIIGQLEDLFG